MEEYREYQIIDIETGEKETFLLTKKEVDLLKRHGERMVKVGKKWSVLKVLAYSVRMRGIDDIRKKYETPEGGASRESGE